MEEIFDFATQVWAIAGVFALSPKNHFISICFIRIRIRFDRHILTVEFLVKLIRLGAVDPKISGLNSSQDF